MIVAYAIMCLIFGSTFLTIKIGLEDGLPPFLFAAMRFLIAGICVTFFLYWKKTSQRLTSQQYMHILLIGFLMTTIPYGVLFWAEQYVSSGISALLVATGPIFTVLFSIYIRQISWKWHLVLGVLLSVSGTMMIVQFDNQHGIGIHAVVAKVCIVLGEFFYALGAILSKKLLQSIDSNLFNGLQMIFGGLGLLVISLLFESYGHMKLSMTSIGSLLYLAIVASIVALGIYYWLIKETNALFPSTWTYLAPVIALFVGVLFSHEKVSMIQIVGGCCILIGVVFLNWQTWAELLQKKGHLSIKTNEYL